MEVGSRVLCCRYFYRLRVRERRIGVREKDQALSTCSETPAASSSAVTLHPRYRQTSAIIEQAFDQRGLVSLGQGLRCQCGDIYLHPCVLL